MTHGNVPIFRFSILAFLVVSAGCSPCTDIAWQYQISPDGRLNAQVTERHCDGSPDFTHRILLRQSGWLHWFSSATEVFALKGQQSISVKWSADSRVLEIWYSGGEIVRREVRWEDVTLLYHGPEERTAVPSEEASPPVPPTSEDAGTWRGGTGRRAIGHGPHRRQP